MYKFRRKPDTICRPSLSLPLFHQSNTESDLSFSSLTKVRKAQEQRQRQRLWCSMKRNNVFQVRLSSSRLSGSSAWEEFRREDCGEIKRVRKRVPTIFLNTSTLYNFTILLKIFPQMEIFPLNVFARPNLIWR